MTPFLQFRLWLRRGPSAERAAASVAGVLFLALVAWALVPVGGEAEDTTAQEALVSAGGATPATDPNLQSSAGNEEAIPTEGVPVAGGSAAPAPTASGAAPAARGVSPGGGAGSAASAADPCSELKSTDQGVTDKEIFVAVAVLNIVGEFGNETFGVRGNVEEIAHAAAAGVNASGGVACRKLRIKVYKVNPVDQNDQRSKCLQIIGDKPFAVIDVSSYTTPAARACFLEAKLPFSGTQTLNEKQAAGQYPYAYSFRVSTQAAIRNWVTESAARGFFQPSNSFNKLGLVVGECDPDEKAEFLRHLKAAGVTGDRLSEFTIRGCSSSSPNDVAQAVAQHRNANVSHVLLAGGVTDMQSYVRQADGIGWKPAYFVSDIGTLTAPALAANWPDGFDRATAITSVRTGERNSGIVSPLVKQCDDWMKASNVAPSKDEADQIPPLICDLFRLFVATADAAGPELTRPKLVSEGLPRVGQFSMVINGDGIYDRPGKVWGGDFIRGIRWYLDCRCWKILDPEMKRGT